ncbi:hypothetical protein HDU79_006715 [Rhizoclosmatium sp. JEL0117]|nr:hypothetical protein HDU79_006715 [Rhizoclosmatium sp. JEL0117]
MTFHPLLKEETAFTLFDTDMSTTAVWFFEGSAPVSFIQDRLKQIVSKNPWLAGKLSKDAQGVIGVLCDESIDWIQSDITASKLISVKQWDLDVNSAHPLVARTVGSIPGVFVPSARACMNKQLPLFSVSVLTSKSHFALVVSLNHAIADGATFYKIANMFSESCMVESLAFERVQSFPQELKLVVPDVSTLEVTLSMRLSMVYTFISKVLQFAWQKVVLRQDCFPTCVRPIPATWIASEKRKSQAEGAGKESFVSSNDIVTSYLLRVTNCHYGAMAVNLRNRMPGIHSLLAGNYESVVLYMPPDFMKPQQIRASISHPSGVLKRMNFQAKLPNPDRWLVKFGNVTNWAGLYGETDMRLRGSGKMVRHETLPVVHEVPMPLSLFIVFAPRKGELAVLTNDEIVKKNTDFFA